MKKSHRKIMTGNVSLRLHKVEKGKLVRLWKPSEDS